MGGDGLKETLPVCPPAPPSANTLPTATGIRPSPNSLREFVGSKTLDEKRDSGSKHNLRNLEGESGDVLSYHEF